MSSFKKLNKADVTTVPYAANKHWDLPYSIIPNDDYAVYYTGSNIPFNVNGPFTTNNQYASLIYSEINHLFYQNYTSSLNTGSLKYNLDTYISASQQRPTSSYFNYNTNPLLIKQFPSGAGGTIGVLSINQSIYGSKILPNNFQISGSDRLIKDDGNGNLYEISQAQNQYIDLNWVTLNYTSTGSLIEPGINFVGNIFYAHGIAVITNQDYIDFPSATCTSYLLYGGSAGSSFNYTSCTTGLSVPIFVKTGVYTDICSLSYPTKTSGNGSIGTSEANCDVAIQPIRISFQNEHIIYENEVRCIIKESDYNLSFNPTLLKYGGQYITPISGSDGYKLTGSFDSTIKDFATGSLEFSGSFTVFQPYVTTIGLYNDEDELLMVAKLAKPIVLSSDTDMTFIVKYDT